METNQYILTGTLYVFSSKAQIKIKQRRLNHSPVTKRQNIKLYLI